MTEEPTTLSCLRYSLLAAVATTALLAATPSAAQEEEEPLVPIAPMLGLWQQDDGGSIEIAGDRLWRTGAGQRIETSEAVCPISFEYLGYLRSADDILFPHEADGTTDGQGKPLADQLRPLLEAGPYLTLTTACCCIDDVNRGAQLIQIDETNLVGIFWREGVYDLERYGAARP